MTERIIEVEDYWIEPYSLEDCRLEEVLDLPDPTVLEDW